MKQNTHLGNAIEAAGNKIKYNNHIKNILADKTILAWILKYSAKECNDMTIDEIVNCIEGEPEVGIIPVSPGLTNSEAITGMQTEDIVQNEGKITYDIRFYIIVPNGDNVKIIINVEAQKKYYVGYDLVTRGIFYGARMLSSQLDTEFSVVNNDTKKYDNIKKVYSIWICMDTPMDVANTITEFHIAQNNIYGNFGRDARYDLLSVIMVCLSNKNYDGGEELHRMLSVLLSTKLSKDEKSEILKNDYGIRMSKELESEVSLMCNLADLIEEKSVVNTLVELVKEGYLDIEVAAKKAEISVQEFEELMEEK